MSDETASDDAGDDHFEERASGSREDRSGDAEPGPRDDRSGDVEQGPRDDRSGDVEQGPRDGDRSDHRTTRGEGSERGDGSGSADSGDERFDRLSRNPTTGPYNSIFHWPSARHPLRVMLNYVVIVVCRICPSMRLKNWLLRRIGVTLGAGVAWGLESTPDVFWPDLITVEDHAIIGYDATILCHEFLQEEYRTGEVVVGEGAMIGAGAIVLPGVEIGAGAQVAANSLVAEDVPPGETVAGVPATPIER